MGSLRGISLSAVLVMAMVIAASLANGAPPQQDNDVIWVDGRQYTFIATPATFESNATSYANTLWDFSLSGLKGQNPISTLSPKSRDYNDGRWHVEVVVFTDAGLGVFDPDGDGNINSELKSAELVMENINLGNIVIDDTNNGL